MTVAKTAKSIVTLSAKERIRELRAAEYMARNAYPRGGTLKQATTRLADAHAAAAKVYEDLLAEFSKEAP